MIELQKGDKLVFKQDMDKEKYIEEVRYVLGNIVTFTENCGNSVYIKEEWQHWYPKYMFVAVIRNGEVIWNERG